MRPILLAVPIAHFVQLAKLTLPGLAHVLRFDHSFIPTEEIEVLCEPLRKPLSSMQPAGTVEIHNSQTVIRYNIEETKQLDKLKPVQKLVDYVCAQASQIQILRLKKELRESSNFENNQGRQKLLDSLTSLGFSPKLTEFLKFAEVEFAKASDAFRYKTSIDNIRCFFAELLNETRRKDR